MASEPLHLFPGSSEGDRILCLLLSLTVKSRGAHVGFGVVQMHDILRKDSR